MRLARPFAWFAGFAAFVALSSPADARLLVLPTVAKDTPLEVKGVTLSLARLLANDAETELRNALDQIQHIARGRLEKIVDG